MKWVILLMLWGDPSMPPLPEEDWAGMFLHKNCATCTGSPRFQTFDACKNALDKIRQSASPGTKTRMNILCVPAVIK